MSNAGYQKDYFNLRINTTASVKEIFDAWTTRRGLEKWFLRKAMTIMLPK